MPRRREHRDGVWVDIDEWQSHRYSASPFDMVGRPVSRGDWLVKVDQSGNQADLEVRRVREVVDGRVYLGTSQVHIRYPGRCLIVNPGVNEFPWAGVV